MNIRNKFIVFLCLTVAFTALFCYISWYCYTNFVDSNCHTHCSSTNVRTCYQRSNNSTKYVGSPCGGDVDIIYTLMINKKNYTQEETISTETQEELHQKCNITLRSCFYDKQKPQNFKLSKKDLLIGPIFGLMFIQMSIASFMPLLIYYFILYLARIIYPNRGALNLDIEMKS